MVSFSSVLNVMSFFLADLEQYFSQDLLRARLLSYRLQALTAFRFYHIVYAYCHSFGQNAMNVMLSQSGLPFDRASLSNFSAAEFVLS